MDKVDLTEALARESHRSRAEAADAVDTLIHRMLKDLKHAAVGSEPNADAKRCKRPSNSRKSGSPKKS